MLEIKASCLPISNLICQFWHAPERTAIDRHITKKHAWHEYETDRRSIGNVVCILPVQVTSQMVSLRLNPSAVSPNNGLWLVSSLPLFFEEYSFATLLIGLVLVSCHALSVYPEKTKAFSLPLKMVVVRSLSCKPSKGWHYAVLLPKGWHFTHTLAHTRVKTAHNHNQTHMYPLELSSTI